MGALPSKAANRISTAIKKFRPILEAAKARDVNESDTVTDLLQELFGYPLEEQQRHAAFVDSDERCPMLRRDLFCGHLFVPEARRRSNCNCCHVVRYSNLAGWSATLILARGAKTVFRTRERGRALVANIIPTPILAAQIRRPIRVPQRRKTDLAHELGERG